MDKREELLRFYGFGQKVQVWNETKIFGIMGNKRQIVFQGCCRAPLHRHHLEQRQLQYQWAFFTVMHFDFRLLLLVQLLTQLINANEFPLWWCIGA